MAVSKATTRTTPISSGLLGRSTATVASAASGAMRSATGLSGRSVARSQLWRMGRLTALRRRSQERCYQRIPGIMTAP
eukprot:13792521-Alexandrium_andersonii.AAC.1